MAEYETLAVTIDTTDSDWDKTIAQVMQGGWKYIESFRDYVIKPSARIVILQRKKNRSNEIEDELALEVQDLKKKLQDEVAQHQEEMRIELDLRMVTQKLAGDLEAELKKLRPSLDVRVLKELQDQHRDATQAFAFVQREVEELKKNLTERDQLIRDLVSKPIPMFLKCPNCGAPHYDEGEWATKPHRTHLCGNCKTEWAPSHHYTVGIKALPKCTDPRCGFCPPRMGDLITPNNLLMGTIGDGVKVKA